MTSITIENISKSYHTNEYTVKAANDICLSLSGNESVAIVGPSGSGKSTLLNIIGLILKPDAGRILINNEDVTQLDDRRKCLLRNRTFGYIVQDFALLNDETVLENIRIPLIYNADIPRKSHKKLIEDAAQSLGIADKLYRKAAKLSGGERQRAAIARAIVCNQPVILADEPTGALDAANKERVMDILMKLNKEQGKMLVIVTHDMSVAGRCERIIEMRDGKI